MVRVLRKSIEQEGIFGPYAAETRILFWEGSGALAPEPAVGGGCRNWEQAGRELEDYTGIRIRLSMSLALAQWLRKGIFKGLGGFGGWAR